MKKFFLSYKIFAIFLSVYFIVGLFIYKDYGIGIEENFQRNSGFYWLNYLNEIIKIDFLNDIITIKINEIRQININLPRPEVFNNYGILFDLPLALIESIFRIDDSIKYFQIRHLSIFIIFFISGIYFYRILNDRTNNKLITFFGSTFYYLSPRIYGSSFFDGKDLFFLSVFTITIFYYLKYEKKKNLRNLIFFSLFSAFSTSSRIFGLIIPFSFFILLLLKIIAKNQIQKNIRNFILFLFFYLLFLYMHWPYLWTISLSEIYNFSESFKVHNYLKVFFNGIFYESSHLPSYYIPLWITISTPIYILLSFFIGLLFFFKRIFNRLINLNEKSFSYDLWKGNKEKLDLIIFLLLFQIVVIILSFHPNLFSSWRHFYFLNFIISYFATISVYYFYLKFKKNKKIIFFSLIIISLFTVELVYKLIIYHPYQSLYFNNIASSKKKQMFEVDSQSLSRVDAIKEIIKSDSLNSNKIIVGTLSWTPLEESLLMIEKEYRNKIIFAGTSNKENSDFLYSNHYYDVDINYTKKYEIPLNFYLYKRLILDDTIIYSIYKKKN